MPPNFDDPNVLMCKLGGGTDPFIPNVKIIEWDKTYMIVETFTKFYLVDGSKNRLCCMCDNKTMGPYDREKINYIIDSINFKPLNKIEVFKHMMSEEEFQINRN